MTKEPCSAPLGQPTARSSESRPPVGSSTSRFVSLRIGPYPTEVRVARQYALATLFGAGVEDSDHADSVELVVSELVTNAITRTLEYAAERGQSFRPDECPVALRVEVRSHWTHLLVTDPDPQTIPVDADDAPVAPGIDAFADAEALPENGRGLHITRTISLTWTVQGDHGKTVHAVVPRSGVTLTKDEEAEAAKSGHPMTLSRTHSLRTTVLSSPLSRSLGARDRARISSSTHYDEARQILNEDSRP